MDMRLYTDSKTFEEVYPTAPFSELIRLALLTAAALRGFRDRTEDDRRLPEATRASASVS